MSKYNLITLSFCLLLLTAQAQPGNKMTFYFIRPVNNTVSTGVNAVQLNNSVDDTVIAYINRAKYTIDVAMYNYSQTSSFSNIGNAINHAYSRGVKIRWIYDAGQSNSGLTILNSNIHTLGSPQGHDYNIMHNKFMIIDAQSGDAADPIVWTGSTNWTSEQLASDYNNVVIIQDSALAAAYTTEFNIMWGGSDLIPNTTTSKFGQYKPPTTQHNFIIGGRHVELYFSPSDNTNDRILSTINTADSDLYFGVYTFTYNNDAKAIVTRKIAGVYTAGIIDQFSQAYAAYNTLSAGLGTNLKVYSGSNLYHSKCMIVDPSDICSDPIVFTGSHNWSAAADEQNDENAIIIHSDTVANIYYQAFYADFTGLGGTISKVKTGCNPIPTAVNVISNTTTELTVYPNPFTDKITLSYNLQTSEKISLTVSNVLGQKVAVLANNELQQFGYHQYTFSPSAAGIYFLQLNDGNTTYTKRLIKVGQ